LDADLYPNLDPKPDSKLDQDLDSDLDLSQIQTMTLTLMLTLALSGLCVRLCLRFTCGGPQGTASPLSLVMNQRNTARAHQFAEWVNQLIGQSLSAGSMSSRFRNKTDAVEKLVRDRSLDVLALIETWHTDSDDICLRFATPEGYAIADVDRPPGRARGGVAIIFNKSLKCSRIPVPTSSTFEAI